MVSALDSPAVVASDTREQTCGELTPPDEGIRKWLVDLDACAHGEAITWLSPSECDQASRLVFATDAQRYRAAHVALRRLLHQNRGLPARTGFAISAHGKPRLERAAGCDFNLSHSCSKALIGISTVSRVGVKEACLKAVGIGLSVAPASFEAGLEAHQADPVDVRFRTVQLGAGVLAAVVVAIGLRLADADLT